MFVTSNWLPNPEHFLIPLKVFKYQSLAIEDEGEKHNSYLSWPRGKILIYTFACFLAKVESLELFRSVVLVGVEVYASWSDSWLQEWYNRCSLCVLTVMEKVCMPVFLCFYVGWIGNAEVGEAYSFSFSTCVCVHLIKDTESSERKM